MLILPKEKAPMIVMSTRLPFLCSLLIVSYMALRLLKCGKTQRSAFILELSSVVASNILISLSIVTLDITNLSLLGINLGVTYLNLHSRMNLLSQFDSVSLSSMVIGNR